MDKGERDSKERQREKEDRVTKSEWYKRKNTLTGRKNKRNRNRQRERQRERQSEKDNMKRIRRERKTKESNVKDKHSSKERKIDR